MFDLEKRLHVGIVGTGTMGKGIVQILIQSDCVDSVFWKGRSYESVTSALAEIECQFERLVNKKRLDSVQTRCFLEKIKVVRDYSDFESIEIFIEAVAEDIEVKRSVFRELSKVSGEDTLLASNTSSLSVTHLASLTTYPENVVGLHFFNPAPVMKLAEVIAGLTTSKATVARALDFARKLGKDPVLVNEAPGFIVNRMLIPMINEAIGILAEDVATAEEIDKAMRLGANHPIGPLALADLIGNDVNLSIMETLHNETGDPKYRAHPLLRKMVRGNLLGRKTGRGFFSY